jgi:hypothetical protein
MKRVVAVAIVGLFFASLAVTQDQRELVKEFTKAEYFGGTKLSFMLLTDKTIDLLFSGPSKDTIKAKTETGTSFYVSGTAEKNLKLDTKFTLVQGEEKFNGSVLENIKNFADGDIAKGTRVSGIIQFDKKINLGKFFSIRNASGNVDFKFSDLALRTINAK